MRLPFTKMEGAGNDYVYVDALQAPFPLERGAELARRLADRHFGIGGDGLIVLAPSALADARMWMWNADGSRGAMCGNGIRCLAKLWHDHGHGRRDALRVETDSGVRAVRLLRDAQGVVVGAQVAMERVRVAAEPAALDAHGRTWHYHAGDAGNPHAVVFTSEDPETLPVAEVGAAFQRAAPFPGGVNVEFVRVTGTDALYQRTFERGSGETLACGSGATVAAQAAWVTGRASGPRVAVRLRGGTLHVLRDGQNLVLEGPARTVFAGETDIPD